MQSLCGANQALCAPPWQPLRDNHRPRVILSCPAHPEYGELRPPQLAHFRCPLRWQLRSAGEEDALFVHCAHIPCQPSRPFPGGALAIKKAQPAYAGNATCTAFAHYIPRHPWKQCISHFDKWLPSLTESKLHIIPASCKRFTRGAQRFDP